MFVLQILFVCTGLFWIRRAYQDGSYCYSMRLCWTTWTVFGPLHFFLVCVGLRNTTTNHNLMTENQFFVGAPLSFKACSGHIVYRIWDYFWHTITGGPQSNHPEPVGTDPSFSGVYFSSALLSTHSWCHCASDSNVAGSATFVAACFVGVSAVHRIFAPRVNHPGIPNLVNCSTFSFLFADLWHIHLWYQDLGTKP